MLLKFFNFRSVQIFRILKIKFFLDATLIQSKEKNFVFSLLILFFWLYLVNKIQKTFLQIFKCKIRKKTSSIQKKFLQRDKIFFHYCNFYVNFIRDTPNLFSTFSNYIGKMNKNKRVSCKYKFFAVKNTKTNLRIEKKYLKFKILII